MCYRQPMFYRILVFLRDLVLLGPDCTYCGKPGASPVCDDCWTDAQL
jgi:hypothetical protein